MDIYPHSPNLNPQIAKLESMAHRHLDGADNSETRLTYNIPLLGADQTLQLTNISESTDPEVTTGVSLINTTSNTPGEYTPPLRSSFIAEQNEMAVYGIPSSNSPSLEYVDLYIPAEFKVLIAVRSLWNLLPETAQVRNQYCCKFEDYPDLARFAHNVVQLACPLLAQGSLYSSSSCEIEFPRSKLKFYIQSHTVSGPQAHINSDDVNLPQLKIEIEDRQICYEFERTVNGVEVRQFPVDPLIRYRNYTTFAPEYDDNDFLIGQSIDPKERLQITAEERAAGKYVPTKEVLATLCALMQATL